MHGCVSPSPAGHVDGGESGPLSELLLADPSAFYSGLCPLSELDHNKRGMSALICVIPCRVSLLLLNLRRAKGLRFTEQRPQRPQPGACPTAVFRDS